MCQFYEHVGQACILETSTIFHLPSGERGKTTLSIKSPTPILDMLPAGDAQTHTVHDHPKRALFRVMIPVRPWSVRLVFQRCGLATKYFIVMVRTP